MKCHTEHADTVFVALNTGQRFGVITVDIHRFAIGAQRYTSLFSGFLIVAHRLEYFKIASFFAARQDHLFLEHFTGAVLGAGDLGLDGLRWKRRVHFVPQGVSQNL